MMRLAILSFLLVQIHSFTIQKSIVQNQPTSTSLQGKKKGKSSTSGKGFGKSTKSTIKVRQTYGLTQRPKDELIDSEGAMEDFFRSKEEWHPLFASLAPSTDVPAFDFLEGVEESGQELSFEEDGENPWKELSQVPSGDDKDDLMAIIAKVLDASQQALVDIPVDEATKEDSDDLHFLEEGRRILCLTRFQVLANEEYFSSDSTAIDRHDLLFRTCWSEIMYLMKEDVPDTGSLIILPDVYELPDLKRFTDMNILRPLSWLGIDTNKLEVASLQRENPCIRLIYKLGDIPDLATRDQQLKEAEANEEE
jgi:hypothetical protein